MYNKTITEMALTEILNLPTKDKYKKLTPLFQISINIFF